MRLAFFLPLALCSSVLAGPVKSRQSGGGRNRNGGGRGGNNNNGGNQGGNNNNGGNQGGNNNNAGGGGGNLQTSLTLDPSVIAEGFALTGQETPADGQVASLTSTNNFINFCAGKTITDGKQITQGSCNPAPMGEIPSTDNIPSSKFTFPKNGDASIAANTQFTISMAVSKWQLGNFVNAQGNYYSAPQQLNGQGQIIGHSHVVIEKIASLDSTAITDPLNFAFFKGVNGDANKGIVTADVTDGLPAGFYRLASINAAANHQPVLAPIAQHGSLDDMVYFTVGNAGGGDNNNNNAGGAAGGNDGGNSGSNKNKNNNNDDDKNADNGGRRGGGRGGRGGN